MWYTTRHEETSSLIYLKFDGQVRLNGIEDMSSMLPIHFGRQNALVTSHWNKERASQSVM